MNIELLKAILTEYLTVLGGSLAAVSIVAALATWFIQYRFSVALANVNAQLNSLNKKQEVAFTWLHTNKAQVVMEMYAKLARLKSLISLTAVMGKSLTENPEAAKHLGESAKIPFKLSEAVGDYISYMQEHEILFDEETYKALLLTGYLLAYSGYDKQLHYFASNPDYKELIDVEHIKSLDFTEINKQLTTAQDSVRTLFAEFLNYAESSK